MKKKVAKISWVLDPETIAALKACPECKENPAVFLTAKKVPCCRLCWEKLADGVDVASVEMAVPKVEESIDFEETTAKYPVSGCCNIKAPKNEEVCCMIKDYFWFLGEIGTKLNVSSGTLTYGFRILQLAKRNELLYGRNPRFLAGNALYIAQF